VSNLIALIIIYGQNGVKEHNYMNTARKYFGDAIKKENICPIEKILQLDKSGTFGIDIQFETIMKIFQNEMSLIEKGEQTEFHNIITLGDIFKNIDSENGEAAIAAMTCYEFIFSKGDGLGVYKIAQMYECGIGVKNDLKKAIEYYQLAENNGFHVTSIMKRIDSNGYIKDLIKAEKRIKELEEENNDLKYKPGGPGYFDAKKSFEQMSIIHDINNGFK